MDRNVDRPSARWVAGAVGVPVLATVFLAGAAKAQPVPSQLPGTAGCVGATSADGCAQGVALLNAHAVTVTPDGRHVYVLSPTDDAVAVFDRNPQTRALTQKGGTDACISETGSGGSCFALGGFLDNPEGVVLNPDPRFLHVASAVSNAVWTFLRDPATGVLGLFNSPCVSETGSFMVCQNGRGLVGPSSLATSPDGRHLYVASFDSDAVAQLKWNQGLNQDNDPAACVSETGSGGECVDGHALDSPFDVAVSPDARNVYVASWGSHAIAVFDRNLVNGALTQKAGTAGCVSETGTGGLCADGVALQGPRGVTVSPDGKNVYATTDGSDAVVVFDRDAATGAISQKAGANGCISDTGSGGACTDGRGLDGAFDVVVSADGLSVFVTAGVSNALVIFDRSSATGALTQKAGKAGCISDTGTGGECTEGRGLSGARRLAMTDVGPSVYVAAVGSSTVSVFDRSPAPYDIDRDGQIDPLTDALLLLRYSFGFRGATLITGAVDLVNCTLCTAVEIEAFIDGLTP